MAGGSITGTIPAVILVSLFCVLLCLEFAMFNDGRRNRVGRCPEVEPAITKLPLVINVPQNYIWAMASGINAARDGLPESSNPYKTFELRTIWLDGYAVGCSRRGPISLRSLP